MRAQIRLTAVLALLKLSTATTPARLFQIATNRSAGQPAASSASSFWLAKVSNGVVTVAAASSGVPNAVMLFSLSIVNVVMVLLLGATLCAVVTCDCSELLELQGDSARVYRPTPVTKRLLAAAKFRCFRPAHPLTCDPMK